MTLALLPSEVERMERERVAKHKPWLALPSWTPAEPKPAEPDHFVWRDVSELFE